MGVRGVRKGDGVECWKIKENGCQRGSGWRWCGVMENKGKWKSEGVRMEMVWSDGR